MSDSGPEEEFRDETEDVGEDIGSSDNENKEPGDGDDDSKDKKKKKNDDKIKIRKISSKPRPKLDPTRATGDRGLGCLKEVFKNVKFKGEGFEFEDLDILVSKYKYWGNRMMPNMKFEDVIEKMEKLGSKREVKFHLRGLFENRIFEMPRVEAANDGDDEEEEELNFDNLLGKQSSNADAARVDDFDALFRDELDELRENDRNADANPPADDIDSELFSHY